VSVAAGRTCDGCGATGGDPLPQVPGLDYCAECMPSVVEFLSAVDALHSRIVREWASELQTIRDRFATLKELPY
jgi:hypothetical protein